MNEKFIQTLYGPNISFYFGHQIHFSTAQADIFISEDDILEAADMIRRQRDRMQYQANTSLIEMRDYARDLANRSR
jgi:hypothetical protein